jgi:hypothetical protein
VTANEIHTTSSCDLKKKEGMERESLTQSPQTVEKISSSLNHYVEKILKREAIARKDGFMKVSDQ